MTVRGTVRAAEDRAAEKRRNPGAFSRPRRDRFPWGMWGKSIFILHSSRTVLEGWKRPLEKLYKNRDFAFGLRYVVQHGKPDKEADDAFYHFTGSSDRILYHFGEGRLVSLVENVANREGKACYTFSK